MVTKPNLANRFIYILKNVLIIDDEELAGNIHWGCVLKIKDLPAPAKLKLCGLLDPPDGHGRDWCLLALKLGFSQERIAALDSHHSSHTMRLLTSADCTIGKLLDCAVICGVKNILCICRSPYNQFA